MSGTAQRETGSAAVQAALWGVQARDWAEIEDEGSRPIFEAVFDAVGVGGGTRLLDVGCGTGLACEVAAARGAKVSGLDAAPGQLEIARERVPGGDFRVGDMQALPYGDHAFDVVTLFSCLFFADDQEAALREAGRVAGRAHPSASSSGGRRSGSRPAPSWPPSDRFYRRELPSSRTCSMSLGSSRTWPAERA